MTDTATRPNLDDLDRDGLYELAKARREAGRELEFDSRTGKDELYAVLLADFTAEDEAGGGNPPTPPGPGMAPRTSTDRQRDGDLSSWAAARRAERGERIVDVDESPSGEEFSRTVHLQHPVTRERVTILPGEDVPNWALDPASGHGSYVDNPKAFAPAAATVDDPPFDVHRAKVDEVIAWAEEPEDVTRRKNRARAAVEREYERTGGPRSTLLKPLERIAATGSTTGE